MSDLLTYFKFTDQNQDTLEIDDAVSVTISLGSEIKNNSFRITLKNTPIDVLSGTTLQHKWINDDGSSIFKAIKAGKGEIINEELIDFYATYTETNPTLTVNTDDYLLFTGIVTKGKCVYKEKKHTIELSGPDRNQVMLDKLMLPIPYKESDAINSPEIIQNIIQLASGYNIPANSRSFDSNGVIQTDGTGSYLIDARLFSDSVISSGTATSVDTRKLIDTGATFQTDGVEKDDWVRNTTSNEFAYVVSVDSETQLTLGKDIFTSAVGYQVSDGFIQDVRPDGTVFPDTAYSKINKPVTDAIQELSQIDYTNTATENDETTGTKIVKRGMRWFIDKKNRFHWYVPGDTPEYIMQVGQTSAISPDTTYHRIFDVELSNEVRDEVNFIIYKAGYDMNGIIIKDFKRAPFSGRPIAKECLRVWMEITREMKQSDADEGNITKNGIDDYTYDGTDGITPVWDSQNRVITGGTTATRLTTYNDNLTEIAKIRAEGKCNAEFQQSANPRWSGKIQLRGEDIVVGELVQFTSKPHGLIDVLMRVKGVTHSITSEQGWITSIDIEEDELEAQTG